VKLERRIVFTIAGVVLFIHLLFATRYGWFRDELYYVACGNRLDWGYVDHPPLVAVFAWLGHGNLHVIRLFASLATCGTIVLAAALAQTFGGGRVAQTAAALATACAPYELAIGHIYTMNAFEPVFWGGIALLIAKSLKDGDSRRLIWLGPLVGVALLNKHSASWPVATFAASLLVYRRELLWKKEVGIAAVIATLIFLPHVRWQIIHGFPTREFARSALNGKNEPYGPLGLFVQLALLSQPLAVPLWLAGWIGLFAFADLRPFRVVGLAVVLLVLLVGFTQAKAYYLGPAWPWLFAAGGVVAERLVRKRIWLVAYASVHVIATLILMPAAIPILDVPHYQQYAATLGMLGKANVGEKMRPAALPQLYADMHGWKELAETTMTAFEALPAEDRQSAAIVTGNYGEASAIEFFGHGLPPIGSGNNGWWLWGPPLANPAVLILVGGVDDDAICQSTTELARADHPLARGDQRDVPIRKCVPKSALAELWPSLKHYR
jgi:hypothetical protein